MMDWIAMLWKIHYASYRHNLDNFNEPVLYVYSCFLFVACLHELKSVVATFALLLAVLNADSIFSLPHIVPKPDAFFVVTQKGN